MSDLFSGVIPFVSAAKALSFRAAASELGVSAAAISKSIAKLEEQVGVALFERTSRRVALTQEGELFYASCREAIAQVETGRELIERARALPTGRVTLSVPFLLGGIVVASLQPFAERFPRLQVDLHLTDRRADLVAEQVDIAIRIGVMEDSALTSRRLGSPRFVTVAAPSYLARHGTPQTIDDLAGHRTLSFVAPNGRPAPWSFAMDGAARTFAPSGPLRVDQGELLVNAARVGIGIVQVFDFMVADDLSTGRLLAVLDDIAAAGPPIQALMRGSANRTQRVRFFNDTATTEMRRVLRSE